MLSTTEDFLRQAAAELPAEWLTHLKQAVTGADFILLSEVIEQIRDREPSLADALARLAEDFQYDEILAFVEKINRFEVDIT